MKIEIGKLRKIPAGTKFWCIPLQSTISLDKDIIVKIEHTICNNDNYFYGKLQEIYFEHCGIPGIADKANGDIGIEFDKTIPYELPNCKYPQPNCDPITYNECVIDGKIYKYDGCLNVNNHVLEDCKEHYSKKNCNYIGCGKIHSVCGIPSKDLNTYYFFANIPEPEKGIFDDVLDDIFKLAEKYKKYR